MSCMHAFSVFRALARKEDLKGGVDQKSSSQMNLFTPEDICKALFGQLLISKIGVLTAMKTKNRILLTSSLFVFCLPLVGQNISQAPASASAQLGDERSHLHAGDELTFKVRLNEPLPKEAHFDVHLSPLGVNQDVSLTSGEPANEQRTEFLLHTKLPQAAFPGEWHIQVVWLFLPGSSWTTNQLKMADLRFTVEGRKFEIPTSATATLLNDKH